MTNLTAPHFTDEDKAREHLEALRWPTGPFCPHCGSFNAKRLPPVRGRKTKTHPEGAIRAGVVQCRDCREQYSVTVGTVFEASKVPLHKWLLCNHLMVSSKKGISAHQIHRMLGVTYKTAWFMCHRIREAMRDVEPTAFGSGGGMVEADETFIGNKEGSKRRKIAYHHKMKVISLVDRDSGSARSFVIDGVGVRDIFPILGENISREAKLMTDELGAYKALGWNFAIHHTVTHSAGEYVNLANRLLHTNTVEGYFSIFKRGMKGIYQHCREKHLHRYLAEFDFRYSNRIANGIDDTERASIALRGIYGKRLTYRRPDYAQA
jgi:transposase-like protein